MLTFISSKHKVQLRLRNLVQQVLFDLKCKGVTKIITIHPEWGLNISTKFHDNTKTKG